MTLEELQRLLDQIHQNSIRTICEDDTAWLSEDELRAVAECIEEAADKIVWARSKLDVAQARREANERGDS